MPNTIEFFFLCFKLHDHLNSTFHRYSYFATQEISLKLCIAYLGPELYAIGSKFPYSFPWN